MSLPGVSFLEGYVRRLVDDELDALLAQLPAVLLDGPKGVGKTATALERCATVRRLDRRAEREVVEADPEVIVDDPTPVLVDEWHRVPDVWDAVRRAVDDDPSGGRFILTGSPPTPSTHSGAGRIATVRMRPTALFERGRCIPTVSFRELLDGSMAPIGGRSPLRLADYVEEIVSGGFPGLRHLSGSAHRVQLDGYLERIVDHDLPEVGFTVRRPAAVRAWLRAYAAATGTTASWESIRDAATAGVADKPAKTTTMVYSELLTALRVLDPLEAWMPSGQVWSRLTKGPKHHLADPALAVRLLDRTRDHFLTGDEPKAIVPREGTLLGGLFESLVALSVRPLAQAGGGRVAHMRTRGGRQEVDFIVERAGGVLALEAKLSGTVADHDVKHLRWLREELGDGLIDAVVITTGPEAYRRRDGIAVVPLALLGP